MVMLVLWETMKSQREIQYDSRDNISVMENRTKKKKKWRRFVSWWACSFGGVKYVSRHREGFCLFI
jgi:hypothetical protein